MHQRDQTTDYDKVFLHDFYASHVDMRWTPPPPKKSKIYGADTNNSTYYSRLRSSSHQITHILNEVSNLTRQLCKKRYFENDELVHNYILFSYLSEKTGKLERG